MTAHAIYVNHCHSILYLHLEIYQISVHKIEAQRFIFPQCLEAVIYRLRCKYKKKPNKFQIFLEKSVFSNRLRLYNNKTEEKEKPSVNLS